MIRSGKKKEFNDITQHTPHTTKWDHNSKEGKKIIVFFEKKVSLLENNEKLSHAQMNPELLTLHTEHFTLSINYTIYNTRMW